MCLTRCTRQFDLLTMFALFAVWHLHRLCLWHDIFIYSMRIQVYGCYEDILAPGQLGRHIWC